MRFLLALCLLASWLFAELKITAVKQLDNGIALSFNQEVKTDVFKSFTLKSEDATRYVYDIKAELAGSAKVFDFQDNVSIRIAQNSKDKVRLVFSSPKEVAIDLNVKQKQANFKIPNLKIIFY